MHNYQGGGKRGEGETRVSLAPPWGSVQLPQLCVAGDVAGTQDRYQGCHIRGDRGVLISRRLSIPLPIPPSVDPSGLRPKRLCPMFLPDGMHCQCEHMGQTSGTHSTGSIESLVILLQTCQ